VSSGEEECPIIYYPIILIITRFSREEGIIFTKLMIHNDIVPVDNLCRYNCIIGGGLPQRRSGVKSEINKG
jgi:hypothetical protein